MAYEVFSGRQLIWEPQCVRVQREENKNVAWHTGELVIVDVGPKSIVKNCLSLMDFVIIASVADTLKMFPVI